MEIALEGQWDILGIVIGEELEDIFFIAPTNGLLESLNPGKQERTTEEVIANFGYQTPANGYFNSEISNTKSA